VVEKTLRMNLLLDYYGQLLTKKQFLCFNMYYCEDLSLGEIAQNLNITRQAVYDILHRSAHILEKYEQRLGLVTLSLKRKELLIRLKEEVEEIKKQLSDNRVSFGPSLEKRVETVDSILKEVLKQEVE
jgi:predicted DNA-binding protein YlxM (UPF0122 family)